MWRQYCVVLGEEQNIEPSQKSQNHIDESQVLDHKNAQVQPNGCDKWLHKFTWPQRPSQDRATWNVLMDFLQSLRFSWYKEWDCIFNHATHIGCFGWSVCASSILLNAPMYQEPLRRPISYCMHPNGFAYPILNLSFSAANQIGKQIC